MRHRGAAPGDLRRSCSSEQPAPGCTVAGSGWRRGMHPGSPDGPRCHRRWRHCSSPHRVAHRSPAPTHVQASEGRGGDGRAGQERNGASKHLFLLQQPQHLAGLTAAWMCQGCLSHWPHPDPWLPPPVLDGLSLGQSHAPGQPWALRTPGRYPASATATGEPGDWASRQTNHGGALKLQGWGRDRHSSLWLRRSDSRVAQALAASLPPSSQTTCCSVSPLPCESQKTQLLPAPP